MSASELNLFRCAVQVGEYQGAYKVCSAGSNLEGGPAGGPAFVSWSVQLLTAASGTEQRAAHSLLQAVACVGDAGTLCACQQLGAGVVSPPLRAMAVCCCAVTHTDASCRSQGGCCKSTVLSACGTHLSLRCGSSCAAGGMGLEAAQRSSCQRSTCNSIPQLMHHLGVTHAFQTRGPRTSSAPSLLHDSARLRWIPAGCLADCACVTHLLVHVCLLCLSCRRASQALPWAQPLRARGRCVSS